jgi:hypothetical protein
MPTVGLPTVTGYIDQQWFLEPLTGDRHPKNYLDALPAEVYNTGPDSHLTRFIYSLIGPSGVGFLRQNALEARMKLEEFGLELFDLEAFYGEPLSFTRITEEVYDEDPRGLIPREAWDMIRAKDAQYRARVLDFLDGVRAGGTPTGLRYVARSGLGHEASIIENYKALFDGYSDDPLGLEYQGKTRFTEEFIVLPRREVGISEVQVLKIQGGTPTSGTFKLVFAAPSNYEITGAISWDTYADNVRTFLEALPSIQPGDVEVTGGPFPDEPIRVRFMNRWGARNVPEFGTQDVTLTDGVNDQVVITSTEQAGVDAADEVVYIPDSDRHHLQEAIDRIRPVTSIPTMGESTGLRQRQFWGVAQATSEYDEVVRYVTGSAAVKWPKRDSLHWIEKGVEHEAPKAFQDRQYQYQSYHNVQAVSTFSEEAVEDPDYGTADTPDLHALHASNHVGVFSQFQTVVFPFLLGFGSVGQFLPDMVLADQVEPLTIRNIVEDTAGSTTTQLINGVYPQDYADLPGVPPVKYDYEQFWASKERSEGTEYIEIDLGTVRGVNTVQFEITSKPVDVSIDFDLLDLHPRRRYVPVSLDHSRSSSTTLTHTPESLNPWTFSEYSFHNDNDELIFTRFIRLSFTRRNNPFSPFVISGTNPEEYHPWSIDVRNLRVGRNVTNM